MATSDFVLDYFPGAVATFAQGIMGRHSAGAGLLKAIMGDRKRDRKTIAVDSRESADHLATTLKQFGFDPDTVGIIHKGNLPAYEAAGCSLGMDPIIGERLWRRRLHGERAYSIVGLTHSLVTADLTQRIQQLVTDPVQPWDALICTSRSARSAVDNMIECYLEYLRRRAIAAPFPPILRPVIPLGIHTSDFARERTWDADRNDFRERLGISPDDIVVLSFGRIDPLNKSHPTPLLQSMKRAQALLAGEIRLHLVMAGQTPHEQIDEDLHAAITRYAPDVPVHIVNGADECISRQSWRAADIFISLSDNIQETFGLTPVEAMASGLPVIVSDWDGYRDTVYDEAVGIRIPTIMPAATGTIGIYFAERHAANIDSSSMYCGSIAQLTSVDIEAAAEAIAALARNPLRRKTMGAAAIDHARARFDWAVVMQGYHDLFDELARIRASSEGNGLRNREDETAMISIPDPFRIFAGFPTATAGGKARVSLGCAADAALADNLLNDRMTGFVREGLMAARDIEVLIALVRERDVSVETLCHRFSDSHRNQVLGTCLWLAKYGVLKFTG